MNESVQRALQLLLCADKTDYIGEPVSQLEHALQSAYFAAQSGHTEAVILASLFHDIGHFASHSKQFQMGELGVVNHEWIGAKLAYEVGFSAEVALLIGNHVNAKRYLASKKPNYYERLSAASRQTLDFQGGIMSEDERQQFEAHPFFKEILQVRINDEKSKELGLVVSPLNDYAPLIQQHLKTHQDDEFIITDFVNDQWVKQVKYFLEKKGKVYVR